MASNPKKNINLLLSLDEKEHKDFQKYLSSPYFNTNNKLLPLYQLIEKEFKEKKKPYYENDFVQKAYGELNMRSYNYHLGELGKHFRRFVAVQSLEKKPLLCNQLVLEDHLHRNGGDFFEKQSTETKKELNKLPLDLKQFQNEYQREELRDSYIKKYKDKRVGDANLQVLSSAIDRNFILKKLYCTVLMLNRSNITKARYNFGMIQMVLDFLNENASFDDELLIRLFYYAFDLLKTENKEDAFQRLNVELLQNIHKIAKDEVNALFCILQNNLKLLKSIKIQLHEQLFELYDLMITKEYIQDDNGKIPVSFHKNVVSIALELSKFDYADKFIEEYKDKLIKSELVRDVYAYNKAKLYIYKGELQNAKPLIKKLDFNDSLYQFAFKCLEIMLLYELKDWDKLELRINAFEVALTPKHSPYISETNTKVYRNFIYCFKRLYYRFSLNPNVTKNNVQQLIDFINGTYQIANRRWVLNKAEEFLKSMK